MVTSNRFAMLIELMCVSVVLPISLGFIVYYGYFSAVSRGTFTRETFYAQQTAGIFKYRMLGRALFLRAQPYLSRLAPRHSRPVDDLMRAGQQDADPTFYFAIFAFNTLFFCLCGAVLWLIFCGGQNKEQFAGRLALLTSLHLIAISQYLLTVYDVLACFLLCAGIVILQLDMGVMLRTVILSVIVAIGCATRETASLVLAFAAALYYSRHGWRLRRDIMPIAGATMAFLLVYVGIRIILGGTQVSDRLTWRQNFEVRALMGLGFFCAIAFLTTLGAPEPARRALRAFWLTSLPYTVSILIVGLWFEIRLWIPMLLCMLALRFNRASVSVGSSEQLQLAESEAS